MISPSPIKSRFRSNSNQPRSGFTLVEMLAVMTMASILLGVMFLMLIGIIRRMNSADMQLASQLNVAQAAETLRELAHGSTEFEVSPDGLQLKLKPAQSSQKSIVLQIASQPFRLELINPDSPIKRIFGLTGLSRGRFSKVESSTLSRPIIALELWPDPAHAKRLNQPAPSENRCVRIEAATELDLPQNATVKEPMK